MKEGDYRRIVKFQIDSRRLYEEASHWRDRGHTPMALNIANEKQKLAARRAKGALYGLLKLIRHHGIVVNRVTGDIQRR